MPTFKFEAMDTTGSEVKDSVDAASEEEAQQIQEVRAEVMEHPASLVPPLRVADEPRRAVDHEAIDEGHVAVAPQAGPEPAGARGDAVIEAIEAVLLLE